MTVTRRFRKGNCSLSISNHRSALSDGNCTNSKTRTSVLQPAYHKQFTTNWILPRLPRSSRPDEELLQVAPLASYQKLLIALLVHQIAESSAVLSLPLAERRHYLGLRTKRQTHLTYLTVHCRRKSKHINITIISYFISAVYVTSYGTLVRHTTPQNVLLVASTVLHLRY